MDTDCMNIAMTLGVAIATSILEFVLAEAMPLGWDSI